MSPAAQIPLFADELRLPDGTPGAFAELDPRVAAAVVVAEHYLHREPPISYAYGLYAHDELLGVVTYGVPASRHLQRSVCPTAPDLVLELNRLWIDDRLGRNTESTFGAASLRALPPRLICSYADPTYGHVGTIYRAMNFHYAGWTDMERRTPRLDYVPADPTTHTRDAYRNGYVETRRRRPKVRYWIPTGNRSDRRRLTALCGWPSLDWHTLPPPTQTGGPSLSDNPTHTT